MRKASVFWRRLPHDNRDYLLVYITALLWALSYFLFTPPVTEMIVLDRVVLFIWLGTTILSSITAIVGLVLKDNLLVERLGVTVLSISPLIYIFIQISIMWVTALQLGVVDSPWQTRIYLIFLAMWAFIFINRRRRELSLRVHLIKNPSALEV